MHPAIVVKKDDDKTKIKDLLDTRFANGWELVRIIDHGDSNEVIYLFKEKSKSKTPDFSNASPPAECAQQ